MIREFGAFDGALLIDKPPGPTSHDIVDAIRRRFRIDKVGHAGTLDPNATGLLIILVGRGTKLSERLMGGDKLYEGEARFGETTNSYDADGELTASLPVPLLSVEELNRIAESFLGDQMQIPPMVSAAKKDGVPLYKLARKGIEVERKPKLIHIFRFQFSDYQEPVGRFQVSCTKGTYIRSLIHDMGQKIGCGAHLATLRRLASGNFTVADAITFDSAMNSPAAELERRVIPFLKLTAAS